MLGAYNYAFTESVFSLHTEPHPRDKAPFFCIHPPFSYKNKGLSWGGNGSEGRFRKLPDTHNARERKKKKEA